MELAFKGQVLLKLSHILVTEEMSFFLSFILFFLRDEIRTILLYSKSFPGGSVGKEPACSAGQQCSIPGFGRSPEEGNGNTFQYYCLDNSMDRGACEPTVHGFINSQTQLSD